MRERSADRRSGAAAPVGGRVTYARRRFAKRLASHDAGCSPLGAPPRRLLAPGPPWRNLRALHMSGALDLALAHSRVPLVVAEGRCCRTPPGSLLAWSNSQDAASRPASQMPRDDTSSGRDTANIGNCSALSNERKALSNVFCRYPVDERSVKRKVSPTPSAQSASTAFCYQTHA